MGSRGSRKSRPLTQVARVVPDVTSFAVDDGFAYSVPDGIEVETGALVRVPLGGRRVRGWVVDVRQGEPTGLKNLLSRSGDLPVFHRRLLDVMRWAAVHYVAPLAALLGKATPPNVPRGSAIDPASGLAEASEVERTPAVASGGRPPTRAWVGPGPWGPVLMPEIESIVTGNRSAMVAASTAVEGAALVSALSETFGDRVVAALPGMTAAELTRAWVTASVDSGRVLVGTRSTALWPVSDLEAAYVVGEARRGMKDKATPTTHARDLLLKRSQVERFGLVLAGLVPSPQALAVAAPSRTTPGSRPWGLVEIVDRRKEDERGTLLGPTARAALRAAVGGRAKTLLFTDRRTTAQRCGRCRELRRCVQCGSGSFDSAECARCGSHADQCPHCGYGRFEMLGAGMARVAAEAGRVVGREHVGDAGSDRLVVVGSERDLPGLEVELSIVVDADGPILAPTYRAGEDALRLLARAVAAAGPGRGRKALIQTLDPSHPVLEALRRAAPVEFIEADAAARVEAGFPPGGEIVVLEVDDPVSGATDDLIETMGDRATVLGPATQRGRTRWLLQGSDLTAARVALRTLVGRWRDGGARVRVDVDPVDL